MPEPIVLPKMGLTMEDGTVNAWLVTEGAAVRAGQALVEVETYKATLEVESPIDGVLLAALPPGSVVPAGATIGVVGAPGEDVAGLLWMPDAPASPAASAPDATPDSTRSTGKRVVASPVARKRAKELGIDLSTVKGTGTHGRVQLADLNEMANASDGVADQSATQPSTTQPGSVAGALEPLTPMRQAIAASMTASAAIPQFTADAEVDCTALLELQSTLRSVGASLSISDVLVAAVARGLIAHPSVNRAYTDGGLVQPSEIAIGIAVALDDGLLVPVIHDAARRSIPELAKERRRLTKAAQAGRLSSRDMTGGTFTISNLGPLRLPRFRALVQPGEAAILAVGSMTMRPFVVDDELAVRTAMSLSLSCDHRAVDGAHAARFLVDLVQALNEPSWLGVALTGEPEA